MRTSFFNVETISSNKLKTSLSDAMYHIFLFEGEGKICVDFVQYDFSGKTVFFCSPFQNIQLESADSFPVEMLSFHGDFYCIEFHKKEVACNGLLFNNIYLFPHFTLDEQTFGEISDYFAKICNINPREEFSGAVLRSWLQLILAICSKVKVQYLPSEQFVQSDLNELKDFQNLVDQHFLSEKGPAFYAGLLNLSPNALSKKIKSQFNKTPSRIIQERVILEAKKQIHLTRKSMKEIAAELNFEDEFYFSKYFKKHTGVSPTQFREETGISIVADLYK